MKGLPFARKEADYQNTQQERKIGCSALLSWFKGPPKETQTPQYRDEKPYHHTPTHAASSFMKTATTPAMIGGVEEQVRRQREETRKDGSKGVTPIA